MGLSVACCVASSSLAAETRDPATPAIDEERQLLKLERELTSAEGKRDIATLRRILDEGFIATFDVGKSVDKEGFIKVVLGDGTDETLSQDLTEEAVRVDHDTAVVFETDTVRGIARGKPYTLVLRISTTYIKRHGRWVALAKHIANVRAATGLEADESTIREANAEWGAAIAAVLSLRSIDA
jgi:Domain of unknown function (DUF4440)